MAGHPRAWGARRAEDTGWILSERPREGGSCPRATRRPYLAAALPVTRAVADVGRVGDHVWAVDVVDGLAFGKRGQVPVVKDLVSKLRLREDRAEAGSDPCPRSQAAAAPSPEPGHCPGAGDSAGTACPVPASRGPCGPEHALSNCVNRGLPGGEVETHEPGTGLPDGEMQDRHTHMCSDSRMHTGASARLCSRRMCSLTAEGHVPTQHLSTW